MQSLMLMDFNFNLLGEVPQYVGLQLKRAYWEVGSFKLTLKRGMPCWDKLRRDTVLYFPDRPDIALLIEKVTINEKQVVADGVPLKGLCKRRVCVPPQVDAVVDQYMAFGWDRFTGDAESAYLHYAANNLTAPEDAKRTMPGLTLAPNRHRGESLPWQARFDKLTEVFEEIGEATGVGWDIRPDFGDKQFVFGAWAGEDRTRGAGRAALSVQLGNVDSITLVDNGSTEVGTIYAGGSGDDENRLILSVGGEKTGYERREGWTEMGGVDDVDMLRLGAQRKLVEAKVTLDVSVRDSGLCRYGRDYDVGDVVAVSMEAGEDVRQMNARLIVMNETHEKGKLKLKATFGDAPVTLTRLLKGNNKATENTAAVRAASVESLSNKELEALLK